jgi:DNA replication protein DnaC
MNNNATLEKLRLLKLSGMERSYRAILESHQDHRLSFEELMAHAVDAEWDERHHRKTKRLIAMAGFRSRSAFAELDFSVQRGLDRNLFMRLADCSWVGKGTSIILAGPTGIGKSFVAQALGSQACTMGLRTQYFNCTKLFQTLKQKRAEGNYQRFVARLAKVKLLILDDFGLVPMDPQDRLSLLEIIEDRYDQAATVFATQIPVAKWFEMIGDPTLADAICDRVVPKAVRINLAGLSMRSIVDKNGSESLAAILPPD